LMLQRLKFTLPEQQQTAFTHSPKIQTSH
jgi:hypothetical protein